MRKRVTLVVVMAILLATLWSGTALAAHNPKGDVRISLRGLGGLLNPLGTIGQATYEVQEAVHSTVTGLTGIELEYSYIWVEADGVPVLAVDPPRLLFSGY